MNFILLVSFLFFNDLGNSEPWLANKAATNCASCHSPGRINRPVKDRRCTLSCQGCHVNPNGGGLRNSYGKWKQNRWLKSFTHEKWNDKPLPAPVDYQKYKKIFDQWISGKTVDERLEKIEENKKIYEKKNKLRELKPKVVSLEVINKAKPGFSKLYEENHKERMNIVAVQKKEFESQIPKTDPYYDERSSSVFGGGDLRLIQLSSQSGEAERENFSWFMAADLGVRWRPTTEMLSFVLESRFLNSPQNSSVDDVFGESRVRSGYLLIDDLPYNSYLQAGLFRPMFGSGGADHTTLISDISGLDQRSVFRGYSVGTTAFNVPFFNISIISPGTNTIVSRDKGVVANAGLRFVSYGASAQISYWNTTSDITGEELKRQMYSLLLGASYKRFTLNFEYLSVSKEFSPSLEDKGAAYLLEGRYRFWRQMYIILNNGSSNVSRSLGEGSGEESMFGVKTFLYSGTELELLYITRSDTSGVTEVNSNSIQAQVHFFF